MEVLERDALLAQLDGLLGQAARGSGRLVLIRGEAGIGKTTLVREFTSGRGQRTLWGMCDPVDPPRPLAPVFDIAREVGGELQLALESSDRNRIVFAVLALLRAEGGPRIVVLEDIQWADEATLDVMKVVGRRVDQLPALVVATFRDDEVGPGHPLSAALGDISRASVVEMDVEELSVSAVERMAVGTDLDPVTLHRATAGNPYFLSEVIASGADVVPTSIRDAISARASRLSTPALEVLRAVAVLGQRCEVSVALGVSGATPDDVDECVTKGMLRRVAGAVEFRHELSQRSVLDAIPPGERREINRRAFTELKGRNPHVETAELVRHAVEAGDPEAVLELAPLAGAHAAALGSHRSAASQYAAALAHGHLLSPEERAALLAAHGRECFLTDDIAVAAEDERSVLEIWRGLGDALNEGRSLTRLAQYEWWDEQAIRSIDTAAEAVRILESLPPGPDLAAAYSRSAQLLMIMGQSERSIPDAVKAVELAEQFGEEQVVVNALNTLGCSLICAGRDGGWESLEDSLRRALSADLEEETARGFNNLITSAVNERRYDLFNRYHEAATAFFADRELDQGERCLIGGVIEAFFGQGLWEDAEKLAREVVRRGQTGGHVEARTVLGRIAARRGDPDAFSWLDLALDRQSVIGGEPTYPLRAYRAEAAWLAGDLSAAAKEIDVAYKALTEYTSGWYVGDLTWVANLVGVDLELDRRLPEPYAFYLEGYPQKAAAAWAEVGCPYEEAAMLAESSDEADLRRSLSILRSFGASPLAAKVEERLKTSGARSIPRGPRASTRANPAGLSDREVEVLSLLAGGLRNSDIADRLVVSRRTVDHHVSAVLTKLGARDRYEAAKIANALGVDAPG